MRRSTATLLACLVTVGATGSAPALAQELPFRGWVSLVTHDRLGWLENENRVSQLCGSAPDVGACYAEQLAPAVEVHDLRRRPDPTSEVAGQLVVTIVPGRGLTAHFREAAGAPAAAFTPDLFLQDWGYGPPFFHQTFVEERDGWYRLPSDPWDEPVWLDAGVVGGLTEQTVQTGDIVELDGEGLTVLGTTERTLTVRPEQDADMWCREGDPPALRPAEPTVLEWSDLLDARGHLRLRFRYMKGC